LIVQLAAAVTAAAINDRNPLTYATYAISTTGQKQLLCQERRFFDWL